MLKSIILFLLASIIFNLNLRSQSKLSCKLIDDQNQGIPYASIKIIPGNFGTITNADGYFDIKFSDKTKLDKILVSCIGYQSKFFLIDSLLKIQKKKPDTHIKLKRQSYQLQEIIVGKQEILKNAKQIFANAITELPKLLDNKPHIGKYYYRQTHCLDTSINRLIEAAISIYDPGNKFNIKDCKFNIDQLQSSLDNRNIDYKTQLQRYIYSRKKKRYSADPRIEANSSYKDTLIQKYLLENLDHNKASFSKFFTSANMLRSTHKGKRKKSLPINPHFKNGRPIITKSFIKEHQFKLDTILMYKNDPIYKIKILPSRKYPTIKYQQHSLIPVGIAYIRIKDFAFLNLDYGYINNPNYKHSKGKIRYYFHFKVKYEEFNNKLYLSYLYSNRFDYNSELSRQRRLIQELSNSEVINNKDSISKQFGTLNWKGDHYAKLIYNQTFWENYSTMTPTDKDQLLKNNLIQKIKNDKKK